MDDRLAAYVVNPHCRLDKYKAELRRKREQQVAADSTGTSPSVAQPASPASDDGEGHHDDTPGSNLAAAAAATTTTTTTEAVGRQSYIDLDTMYQM